MLRSGGLWLFTSLGEGDLNEWRVRRLQPYARELTMHDKMAEFQWFGYAPCGIETRYSDAGE